MKFGLSAMFIVPKPWEPGKEARVFQEAVELAILGDQLGFDSVWALEHHFLEEYSHSSAPDIYFACVAGQTTRIRFGHGICLMLPQINPPARVAERTATLDLLSGGRLELGTGRSATWTELGGFLVEPDDTREMWEESTRAVVQMWTQNECAFDGVHVKMPPRNVIPKPLQQPHPPLWVAVQSPETAVLAGQFGLGMLGVTLGGIAKYADLVADYRRAIRDCEPIGLVVNNQVRANAQMFCHPDGAYARTAVGGKTEQLNAVLSAYLMTIGSAYPSPAYHAHSLRTGAAFQPQLGADQVDQLIGTPDEVARALEGWEKLGVDAINLNIGGLHTTHQEVLESMRLFAREVMPAFQHGRAAVA